MSGSEEVGSANKLNLGTLWYRPPEIILGDSAYGMEFDSWSLGCVALEAMLGGVIFDETAPLIHDVIPPRAPQMCESVQEASRHAQVDLIIVFRPRWISIVSITVGDPILAAQAARPQFD